MSVNGNCVAVEAEGTHHLFDAKTFTVNPSDGYLHVVDSDDVSLAVFAPGRWTGAYHVPAAEPAP